MEEALELLGCAATHQPAAPMAARAAARPTRRRFAAPALGATTRGSLRRDGPSDQTWTRRAIATMTSSPNRNRGTVIATTVRNNLSFFSVAGTSAMALSPWRAAASLRRVASVEDWGGGSLTPC